MYLLVSVCFFYSFPYFGLTSAFNYISDDDVHDIFEKQVKLESINPQLNEINQKLDSIIETLKHISTKIGGTSSNCGKDDHDIQNPRSCAELRLGGVTSDGIYKIFPTGLGRAVKVLCDMTTDGGGWTVFVRRGNYSDQMTSFNRSWLDYKNGFGDAEGEYWLGNDAIHLMTSEEDNVLRANLIFEAETTGIELGSFAVGNESLNYTLYIDISPTISKAEYFIRYVNDHWAQHNNTPFSTYDRHHWHNHCAKVYNGGWWYIDITICSFLPLTGNYFQEDRRNCMIYGIDWLRSILKNCATGADLMIRPYNFTIAG